MKNPSTQTVESLMEAYNSKYDTQKPNTKPTSSVKVRIIDENTKDPRVELTKQMFIDETITSDEYFDRIDHSSPEYFAFKTDKSSGNTRIIEYSMGDVDAKYPHHEWIQMLIDKGVTIDDYNDYEEYLDIRKGLFSKEHLADHSIDTAEKTAYINKEIHNYQIIQEAKRTDPDVKDWTLVGEKAHPSIPGRMYVCKTDSEIKIKQKMTSNGKPELTDKQKTDLQNKGIEPEGWEVVHTDKKGNIL